MQGVADTVGCSCLCGFMKALALFTSKRMVSICFPHARLHGIDIGKGCVKTMLATIAVAQLLASPTVA